MKITYVENKNMNHNEIQIVTHPKNMKIVKLLAKQFQDELGELEVYDEYRNIYPIAILSIYYVELIDHKLFIYTEDNVYRINGKLIELKEKLASYGFYQVNVRTLVNVKHVIQYTTTKECRRRMILDNGDILVSSRRFKREFDAMIADRQNIERVK